MCTQGKSYLSRNQMAQQSFNRKCTVQNPIPLHPKFDIVCTNSQLNIIIFQFQTFNLRVITKKLGYTILIIIIIIKLEY